MEYLLTFPVQFDAILANRVLAGLHCSARLMPVPRAVSASCGTCVEAVMPDGVPLPLEALWAARVAIDHIFVRSGEEWVPWTED